MHSSVSMPVLMSMVLLLEHEELQFPTTHFQTSGKSW